MGPVEAFTTAWRKSFTYGGSATRSEYWWFYLLNLVATMLIVVLGSASGSSDSGSSLGFVYVTASLFPTISIIVRRLHDIGKDWKWIFISLVPFIGSIWFIYLMCQPSGRYQTN
jgi:uncharacterized membrane protein YhaH (DUF805 family)